MTGAGQFRIDHLAPGEEDAVLRAADLFDERPLRRAVREYLVDRDNVLFLAYEGDRPVGFLRGTGIGQLHTDRRQMFLYEVSVEPDFRRQGYASAMVRALLEYCAAHRFDEVFVFTDDPENEAAAQLYRSTGGVTETVGDRMYVYRLPDSGSSRGRTRARRTGPSRPAPSEP